MVATHTFSLRLPLPAHLPPQQAVAHLQGFESLITPHPYLVAYERRPVALAELVDDPFFRADGLCLRAYHVTERIRLLPGLGKDIHIPAVFQSFEGGVRCRADASGGVRVWSEYEVAPRLGSRGVKAASLDSERDGSDGASLDSFVEGYDLVETVRLTCSPLVKRFVVKSIEPAHREICERMIEEMVGMYGVQ